MILLLVTVLVLVLILFIWEKTQKKDISIETTNKWENKDLPFSRKFLLTGAEYAFWKKLKPVTDEYDLILCPKVRMEDFIQVNENDFKKKQHYRGKIKSRHIDFILCDSKLNILAGVELDDNSHKKASVREVDDMKNMAFQALKLPLFRIVMSKGDYDKQIESIIESLSLPCKKNSSDVEKTK